MRGHGRWHSSHGQGEEPDGKTKGDSLKDFSQTGRRDHHRNIKLPLPDPHGILKAATTRLL